MTIEILQRDLNIKFEAEVDDLASLPALVLCVQSQTLCEEELVYFQSSSGGWGKVTEMWIVVDYAKQ